MNWDFLKSITFWLNILTILVALAAELFGFGDFEPAPWVDGVVIVIVILINLFKQSFPKISTRFYL